MVTRVVYTFTIESMIRGYHEYQMIWGAPTVGEELHCHRELGNSHDPYAVAVKKMIGGEERGVGHVPHRISVWYMSNNSVRSIFVSHWCIVFVVPCSAARFPTSYLCAPVRYKYGSLPRACFSVSFVTSAFASSIAFDGTLFFSEPFGSGRLAEDEAVISHLYLKYFKIPAITVLYSSAWTDHVCQ